MKVKIFIAAAILFFLSCEERVFLDRKPDMVLENGIYRFDPAGYEYDKVILSGTGSVITLRACAEGTEPPPLLFNGESGLYDLFVVNGGDTVFSGGTYLGDTARPSLKITVLDVKQGDSFIISPPDGMPSVIDGGYGSKGYENWMGAGEKILLSSLAAENIFNIKYLIETHHDADHYGGLGDVKNDGRFIFETYLTYESDLPDFGDTLYFSPAVKGVLLHYGNLTNKTETDENDRSVAIKMIYGDFEMIFSGDIGISAEAEILDRGLLDPNEKYEILKVAHHGSKYSSSTGFLNAVLPAFSVISSGEGNPYGHPAPETLDKLKKIKSEIFRTDINSTLEIYSDGGSFQTIYKK
jgi:competence protein ComEC